MIRKLVSNFTRSLRDDRGQTLVMAALVLVMLLTMVGFVIDTGHLYFSYEELQSSTNSAALAAANGLDTSYAQAEYQGAEYSAAPTSITKQYGYTGNGNNTYSNLDVTNLTITPGCIGSSVPMAANVPCEGITLGNGNSTTANAVQISQTIKVRTFFAPFLGIPYVNLTASSAALMRGTPAPYNIALILDTTGSMQAQDATCGTTQLQCAENGMQDFLQDISPCAQTGNCTPTAQSNYSNYTNGFDRVALFAFPNGQVNAIPNDYCGGSNNGYPQDERNPQPTYSISYKNAIPYVLPAIGGSTALIDYYYNAQTGTTGPWYNRKPVYGTVGTYQVTYEVTHGLGDANGFTTYYQQSGSTALDSGSDLVKALGGGGCPGIQAPYLDGTYYPGVIYQAQSYLEAEKAAYPGSQNVMIILGDGDENVNYDWLMENDVQGLGGYSSPPNNWIYAMVSPPSSLDGNLAWTNGLTPTGYDWDSGTEVGTAPSLSNNYYPSWDNDCGQAVLAAAYAKALGTKIYVVAYGSPTSGAQTGPGWTPYYNYAYGYSCPTDITGIPLSQVTVTSGSTSKTISTGLTGTSQGITPCQSLQDIATSDSTFFSDSNITGTDTGCHGTTNSSYGSLARIFQAIAGQLDHSRLIPNGSFTPSV